MKIRGLILSLLVAGGFYVMMQTINESTMHPIEWIQKQQIDDASPYSSIVFKYPGLDDQRMVTWKVDEVGEVDRLLQFLQAYEYERVPPETLQLFDDQTLFSIDLQDQTGNRMTILIEEGILIHNERLYYEVVDGPFQVDWLIDFILSNKP